ncbi:MAG: J domain-containing protein [Chitinophagaceae bacterium]|nr:MAG: J domain-containing protein [Chitinophagaceae bacterium]
MQPKDYYKILNVPPTAGPEEIRKAFRNLALKYHPDRNNGDRYKEAMFREVQEAYETLSDQKSREDYNYRRWYTRSHGKQFREQAITPVQIHAEAGKLANYVSTANNLQVDYDVLSSRIRGVLSKENIELLLQFNETTTNEKIIRLLLKSCEPLPARYLDPICQLMAKVAGTDNTLLSAIRAYNDERVSEEWWQKRTGWLVLLSAILICWLMYIYAS